jgi:hypothetical protein
VTLNGFGAVRNFAVGGDAQLAAGRTVAGTLACGYGLWRTGRVLSVGLRVKGGRDGRQSVSALRF